jgi:hypothetical protein
MNDSSEHFVYSKAKLIDAVADGSFEAFTKIAHRALEEGSWPSVVADAAGLHRAGTIDLVAALSAGSDERISYGTQRFIEQILPSLELELAPLLELIEILSARSKGDGIPYYLVASFSEWCDAQEQRPMLAIEAIRSGQAPVPLLRPALMSGLRVDRSNVLPLLLGMLRSTNTEEQGVAADVLGRFEQLSTNELDSAIGALQQALAQATGERSVVPLRALLAIAFRAQENEIVGFSALDAVKSRSDVHVRHAVSAELMFAVKKVSQPLVSAALELLAETQKYEENTIEAIDQILSKALATDHPHAANWLLDNLLARRAATIQVLDSTRNALWTGEATLRSATLTRWLISPDPAHFAAVRDMCKGLAGSAPHFDLDFCNADLSVRQAERIARRACASLMVFPETVASILASLLRTGPTQAMPLIERLLFDPLLISYWLGPRKYLEALLPDAPQAMAAVIGRVFELHDHYMAEVNAAGKIHELRPSQHHRFLAETKRREENRKISKSAHKQSLFASLISTSIMLYGDSTIYDMHVDEGKKVRQETQMRSQEFSHELPRLDIIDPFGSWYSRERLLQDEDEE